MVKDHFKFSKVSSVRKLGLEVPCSLFAITQLLHQHAMISIISLYHLIIKNTIATSKLTSSMTFKNSIFLGGIYREQRVLFSNLKK